MLRIVTSHTNTRKPTGVGEGRKRDVQGRASKLPCGQQANPLTWMSAPPGYWSMILTTLNEPRVRKAHCNVTTRTALTQSCLSHCRNTRSRCFRGKAPRNFGVAEKRFGWDEPPSGGCRKVRSSREIRKLAELRCLSCCGCQMSKSRSESATRVLCA